MQKCCICNKLEDEEIAAKFMSYLNELFGGFVCLSCKELNNRNAQKKKQHQIQED
jgi:hypothetical protein